ncbi:MAG: YchF/TatD family DNA exonuclease [Planctomycetota bacterium]|nr:MAG: YchF/TatD family DNA exonuclease [Planctomycetota bacterium]
MIIDTHAHLDFSQFDKDLDTVLDRSRDAGIEHVITIGIDVETSQKAIELAGKYDFISAAVGFHPHDASKASPEGMDAIRGLAAHPQVRAIGEVGLDFYRDHSPRDVQEKVFRRFIEMSIDIGKPLIVHLRNSWPQGLDVLEEYSGRIRGVTHCFSGGEEELHRVLELGFYISVGGPITYKKNDDLRSVVAKCPHDRLMLETDCPFLSPEGRRGRRNEPAYIALMLPTFARVMGLSSKDVARITTLNALRFFGLGGHTGRWENIFAYSLRKSLYLNVTNRCTCECEFCKRTSTCELAGYNLKLMREPHADDLVNAAGDVSRYKEVVFCGYGEPLLELDVVLEAAKRMRADAKRLRLNTNGHGNLIHGRDVVPELMSAGITHVSVSLNAPDAETYTKLCRPEHGEAAFTAVLDFIRAAGAAGMEVTATAVDLPDLDLDGVKRLAGELGAEFRLRSFSR